MSYSAGIKDADLPEIWAFADRESGRGQKLALRLTIGKAGGGAVAAFGGAVSIGEIGSIVGAWLILIGFSAALVSEILSWVYQPDRTWYDGRAAAESIKTLAWRYAVCADPFPASLTESEAQKRLRDRVHAVTAELSDVLVFTGEGVIATSAMNDLRAQPFDVRKKSYIEGRTKEQQRWYASKARFNQKWSRVWRSALLLTEIIAVTLALGKVIGGWPIDFAGLLGAVIAAGAAWVAVKQFSPLAAAYSVASNELSMQAEVLASTEESAWTHEVADAEEAISREHTTWIASRTGRIKRSV